MSRHIYHALVSPPLIISLMVLVVGGLVLLMVVQTHLALWIQCRLSGCPVSIMDLIGASLRRQKPQTIAAALIRLTRERVQISFQELEQHATKGGDVLRTAAAMIEQKKHSIGLTWEELCAMDLAGENPLDNVRHIIGEHSEA